MAESPPGQCAVLLLADRAGTAIEAPLDPRWPALAGRLGGNPLVVRATDPLWPHLGRVGNVALPLRALGRRRRERVSHAVELIGACDLDPRGDVATLDAFGRCRLLLARALAAAPRPIVLDRLAGGLDGDARAALVATVRRAAAAGRAPMLTIASDRTEALLLADLLGVATPGDPAIALFPPARLLADPPDLAAARRLGVANLLPAQAGDPDDEDAGARLDPSGVAVPARWADGVRAGDPCVLAVDPARIAFAAVPAAELGFGALAATLTDARHCGTHLRLTVRLADGVTLLVHRPPFSLGANDARIAAEPLGAAIAWRGDHAVAFPRPAG